MPPADVAAELNFDMVGRSDGSVEMIAAVSSDLFRAASEASRGLGMQVIPERNPQKRLLYFTDSYHLARPGVPTVSAFTGLHADYHQPSDEADKIHYERLAEIVEMAARMVGHYADDGPRPRYQRPARFITPEIPVP